MWFSVVCTPINNHKLCHHSGRVSPQQIVTTVMTRIVVDKGTDHISICFLPQYQRQIIFSERKQKRALRDTLMQAAWYGLLSTMAN